MFLSAGFVPVGIKQSGKTLLPDGGTRFLKSDATKNATGRGPIDAERQSEFTYCDKRNVSLSVRCEQERDVFVLLFPADPYSSN